MPAVQLLAVILLVSTTTLTLGNNRHPSKQWHTQCPPPCSCTQTYSEDFATYLNTVDCAHKDLRVFPSVPEDTNRLLPSNNRIQDWTPLDRFVTNEDTVVGVSLLLSLVDLDLSNTGLQSSDLNRLGHIGSNLHFLSLADNQISSIESIHLVGMPLLLSLNLSNNQLSHVSTLHHPKLRTLVLSTNRLSYLPADTLSETTGLMTLDLSHNQLASLEKESLPRSLEYLDMSHNVLGSMHSVQLEQLAHLTNLDLSYNHLSYFSTYGFHDSRLEALRLDGNPIYEIPADQFSSLPHLFQLSIANMPKLRVILRHAFNNLPHLRLLNLNDNTELVFMDDEALVNIPQLNILFLHNCKLRTLAKTLLQSLPKLQQLSLYGNELRCDCHMQWIQQIIQASNNQSTAHPVDIVDKKAMRCSTPAALRDSPIETADMTTPSCVPLMASFPSNRVVVTQGSEVTIPCYVNGAPEVYWILPNGDTIKVNESEATPAVHGSSLHIPIVRTMDSGLYRCVAVTDEGQPPSTVTVFVVVSSQNVAIEAKVVGTNSIQVSWSSNRFSSLVPSANYFLTFVEVECPDKQGRTSLNIIELQAGRHLIPNVFANTSYTVCLSLIRGVTTIELNCTNVTTADDGNIRGDSHQSPPGMTTHNMNEDSGKNSLTKRDTIVALVSVATTIIVLGLILMLLMCKARCKRNQSYLKLQQEVAVIQPLHELQKARPPLQKSYPHSSLFNNDKWIDQSVNEHLLGDHNW